MNFYDPSIMSVGRGAPGMNPAINPYRQNMPGLAAPELYGPPGFAPRQQRPHERSAFSLS